MEDPIDTPLPPLSTTMTGTTWGGHGGSAKLSHGKDPMASTMFPSIETSMHHRTNKEWMDKTIQASESTLRQHGESNKVRVTSSIVKEVVQNNDTHHLGKVNMGFRTKMGQTIEMIRKLETAIKDNITETGNLEKSKRQLVKGKAELVEPMNMVKKRFKIREVRPARENIEDPVHLALEAEFSALASSSEQLKNQADATAEMFDRLNAMREKMRADLRDKKHALDLDNTCLTLTHESAPLHPPSEETIHTKTTTLAGEIPPSSPTSVLMGENASGRFSYEWLFTKEEREALKDAFYAVANENSEILAQSFETVYSKAGVHVTEQNTVIEMMQLHPDTKLDWAKFCQALSMMRGQREHPVMLPPIWRSKTNALVDNSHALLMSSNRLRYQSQELVAHCDEIRRKTHIVVQKNLRKKVQESTDMRKMCEKRIMEADLEIKRLEASEKSLAVAYEAKAKPLAVAEARYNIRRQRKHREEVHDEVEDLMAKEVEELQKGVAALQRELDMTRATLMELKENKKTLEADYEDKTQALELDQKCLKLEDKANQKRSMYNAFLQGHI
mmetsp:Transcript_42447/g.51457  ORF Transcript_42447/g.51457 Transcript_42447/m.51457 type:complete len:559 (+) Transcript_42447:151-1827(+)